MKFIKLFSYVSLLMYAHGLFSTVEWIGLLNSSVTNEDISIIGDCNIYDNQVSVIASTQDVTITVDADATIQGQNESIIWLEAHAPYKITIKVNHSLNFFGGQNDLNDAFKIIGYGNGTIVWEFGHDGKLTFGRYHQSGSGEFWLEYDPEENFCPDNSFHPVKKGQISFKGRAKYGYLVYDNFNATSHITFASSKSETSKIYLKMKDLTRFGLILDANA